MAGEIILYTTDDGQARVSLREIDGSVWLTQAQMAGLFQVTPQAITQHVRAIYAEGEWAPAATCKEDLQVRTEGSRAAANKEETEDTLKTIEQVGNKLEGRGKEP